MYAQPSPTLTVLLGAQPSLLLASSKVFSSKGTDAMDRVGKIIAARASERRALDPKVATTVYSTGGSGGGALNTSPIRRSNSDIGDVI